MQPPFNGADFDFEKHTLLVVDDNPANLSVIVDFLSDCGFQVMVARDGNSALQLATSERPDLILLDVMMPEMDGFEICRRLNADDQTRHIMVIFMTVLTETEHKIRGFELGAVDYITKPFQPDELLARVTTHLRLKDLTENLEQEVHRQTEALTEANRRLNQKIAESRALETQLQHANKMEAIGTLAGGIAHDFNNILGIIVGHTQLAQLDEHLCAATQEHLKHVLHASTRASDLVQQILMFSQQRELDRKPVKASLIIADVLKMLRASLPATIDIQPDIQDRQATVLADSTQIHQVLMNLCTNAAHAMPDQGGILRISMQRKTLATPQSSHLAPGQYLQLSVSDNGHGMDRSTLERIFEPYFTTKKQDEGTGLGLAVVHGIVTGYGGAIQVHSQPGKGTAFDVFLPLIQPLEDEDQTASRLEKLPRGSEHILFVDDEELIVTLSTEMLQHLGYRVTATTSTIDAWHLFESRPFDFDLVITDMTMPHLTGDELAKKMLRRHPDLPIIICTGYSDRVSPEQARSMGIRDYLTKPLVIEQLAKAIRKVLDRDTH